jgi:NAD(P)-dependent dehydrogenase (short-subunit alcohol dehydrogenase family)
MLTNVLGSFITAKAVANDMVANKVQGSIVLIASMSGSIANRVRQTAFTSNPQDIHANTGSRV